MEKRRKAIAWRPAVAVFVGLLGAVVLVSAGCGEDESPATGVTVAKQVTKSNQGALLKEMFEELGVEVKWGDITAGKPPADDHGAMTDGLAIEPDGTETGFHIQLPGSHYRWPPVDGPLVYGIPGAANIKGGPSFDFYFPNGHEAPLPPERERERMGDLNKRITEGLCRKFAGRACGEFQPAIV